VTGIPGAGGDPIPAAPKRAEGEGPFRSHRRLPVLGRREIRIKDGIVYDAKKLLADVQEMVQQAKDASGYVITQPGLDAPARKSTSR
jgi:hypothetical protein